jgi:hypothetical protein
VVTSKLFRPLLAIVAVAAASAVLAPSIASAEPIAARSGVPGVLQPPAGTVAVSTYRVKVGFQIYRCANGAWSLKAPAAMAFNKVDGASVYHYGGPTWQSMTDGSLVTAVKRAESSVPGAVPELLLEVNSHGGTEGGELSKISYIQRLNTSGGLAPSGPCTDGAEQPIAYGADYVFFAPAA